LSFLFKPTCIHVHQLLPSSIKKRICSIAITTTPWVKSLLKYPINNKALFCFPVILIGFLDLATTVIGVTFYGAREVNPLFSGLTETNILIFIGIKSSAVFLTGFLFYEGASIAKISPSGSRLGIRFLEIGYFVSLTLLTFIVTNNIFTIFQLT
jgi:hypothetical protein